jgi:hypothetical protein
VLEENTGTLYTPQSLGRFCWQGDLDVKYYGGYKIPDEAPADLKRAATVGVRDDYFAYLRGAILTGVRMIAHKSARVQYYPTAGQTVTGQAGTATDPVWRAIQTALIPYMRWWV